MAFLPQQTQLSTRIVEATEAGEKFVEIFYDAVDRKRQVMSGLYSSNSLVVWNGNTKSGSAGIVEFYQSLPGSNHRLLSFDCQPVQSTSVATSVLVSCKGSVKFDGQSSEKKFSQNFLLTKEGEVWKVGSDCFRFLDHQVL